MYALGRTNPVTFKRALHVKYVFGQIYNINNIRVVDKARRFLSSILIGKYPKLCSAADSERLHTNLYPYTHRDSWNTTIFRYSANWWVNYPNAAEESLKRRHLRYALSSGRSEADRVWYYGFVPV